MARNCWRWKSSPKIAQHLADAVQRAKEHTGHWITPFGRHEMEDVMALCTRVEHHWLRFLLPSFHRLRKLLQERYDFSAHAVKPQWSRLLKELQEVYQAEDRVRENDERFAIDFLPGNAQELLDRLRSLHRAQEQLNPAAQALRSLVISDRQAHAQLSDLLATKELLSDLESALADLLAFSQDHQLNEIPEQLQKLDDALAILPDVAAVSWGLRRRRRRQLPLCNPAAPQRR